MCSKDTAGETSGWYADKNAATNAQEVLRTTFEYTKQLLMTVLKPNEFDALFVNPQRASTAPAHTLEEVQQSLEAARAIYEARTGFAGDAFRTIVPTTSFSTASATPNLKTIGKAKWKARLWLTGLSEKLLYYSNIFDVMVQHHPEYVSLAYGTFKLLFVAIANHAETASKLSKSISRIADSLPQHSLHLVLYPTPQMQESVARLYAHVISFFVSALRWYAESRAMHVVTSVFKPWALRFQAEYDAITTESRHVRRLADAAAKAELRDTRLETLQANRNLELVKHELTSIKADNQRLETLLVSKFGIIQNSMLDMFTELRSDFGTQRATLSQVHLNQMLSLPLWNALPTSGDALRFCRSLRKRYNPRQHGAKLSLPTLQKMEHWSAQRDEGGSTILLVDTHVSQVAKAFMVDLIDLFLAHKKLVAWTLRYADYQDHRIDVADLIRMLVMQALQLGSERLLDAPFPLAVSHLREAASLADWTKILTRLLACLEHCFIVIDADLLTHATAQDRGEAIELLESLRTGLSNAKIVIATSSINQSYALDLQQSGVSTRVSTTEDRSWRSQGPVRKRARLRR